MKMKKQKYNFPKSHKPFTDKYFLRSNEILKAEGINPWVKMQVFVRKGPGIVDGLEEAINLIDNYSDLKEHGGLIQSLRDGDTYQSKETLMTIEGSLQDMIELETMYLGVISRAVTLANGGSEPNLASAKDKMKQIVEIAQRPVMYFGARHWDYSLDDAISYAAFQGGAIGCSTDIGAETVGKLGLGTIPHALVLAVGSTKKAAEIFDKHIDEDIPRVVLVDTFNKEIFDTIEVADSLGDRLYGVRLDTCGENYGEGTKHSSTRPYIDGKGVTCELAYKLRNTLDENGHENVKIVLSSGFGDPKKVAEFVHYEKQHEVQLFDSLGVGGIFDARFATADIVRLDNKPFSKTGRKEKLNDRLKNHYWRQR